MSNTSKVSISKTNTSKTNTSKTNTANPHIQKRNIIILAAGKSSRFNGVKQLANINGTALLNHCIAQLKPLSNTAIYVTLGANIEAILPILALNVQPIYSQNWALGMGHSLADSVTKLAENSSHILVCLADQVMINTAHYQNLISQSIQFPEQIIATVSNNKMMAPAVFPQKYFAQLMQLQGDKGAVKLLKEYRTDVISIEHTQAIFDFDTVEDLQNYHNMSKKMEQA